MWKIKWQPVERYTRSSGAHPATHFITRQTTPGCPNLWRLAVSLIHQRLSQPQVYSSVFARWWIISHLASKTQKLFVSLLFNFDSNYVALEIFGLIYKTQADQISHKNHTIILWFNWMQKCTYEWFYEHIMLPFQAIFNSVQWKTML